jgi:periplasmic copper chaperone A
MTHKFLMACVFGLAQLFAAVPAMAHGDYIHQITMVIKKQFDKPGDPLTVAPVSVEGDSAVAGWSQSGRGGRAFLQRDKHQWSIALCGGAGLTQADVLQSTGMKPDAALRLAKAVAAAEAKLGAQQSKLFDSFEGMIKIDAAAGHDANGGHGQHTGHGDHAPK